MSKFKFEVMEIIDFQQHKKVVTLDSDEKLKAFSKIREMYPGPPYHIKFLSEE